MIVQNMKSQKKEKHIFNQLTVDTNHCWSTLLLLRAVLIEDSLSLEETSL
jgi:hypothetical protein